ncbi:PP0621 family protein [Thioflexithrix psekupsensis]|uniref:TRASH domain-containing protein n=1 Tax=Thioflexithrix psekupsensis TaxID=1570016 RepID=A0A251XA43_9GAMM|nr:PP0621 family protein [Thioflexithrix psekupsensis]OUD15214.1 hypothetical protein TPSD3_01395 [Thioflexithrix psekupsensis]
MFFRWIVLAIILWLTWHVARRLWREHQKRELQAQQPTELSTQKMLRCPQCGVHFPEQEGVKSGETVFCSTRCAREHVKS